MIQRKTQSLAYWLGDYRVDESDHEFLYDTLTEATEPQRLEDITLAIIRRRCQREESRIRNELTRGLIYDPSESYKVGDEIVFPAFDYRLAQVLGVRAGQNPEHGGFDVVKVRFEAAKGREYSAKGQEYSAKGERMFAAALLTPHVLNRHGAEVQLGDEKLLTPEELLEEVGDVVAKRIETHLVDNPKLFVSAGPLWLTSDQMVGVSLGHLNLAEAAIEMNSSPVPTRTLLDALELQPDAAESVRIFSLETALYGDVRFVQVGAGGQVAWSLRRMMPPTAVVMPTVLHYEPVAYDRGALDVELLKTEWELNDELTEGGLAEEVPASLPNATVLLTYPHLVSGTLPVPPTVRSVLPRGEGLCSAVTFVDGRWGTRFQAWVVHRGRYVAGLDGWYAQHKLPVGARITLERTNKAGEVVIDFRPLRGKREWVRTARIEDGRLTFQMQRHQISCDYDDHVALVVSDLGEIEAFRLALAQREMSVRHLVELVMPELTKLSPQGTAHVKSLYSAVNVIHRLPPGPVFTALAQLAGTTDTGSGYWSM